jgi:hypothetical protein
MKILIILSLIFTQPVLSQGPQDNTTEPDRSREAEEFSPDMTEEEEEREQREEEEAREQAERERWILEERARGYEPTSEEYRPVFPKRKRVPDVTD